MFFQLWRGFRFSTFQALWVLPFFSLRVQHKFISKLVIKVTRKPCVVAVQNELYLYHASKTHPVWLSSTPTDSWCSMLVMGSSGLTVLVLLESCKVLCKVCIQSYKTKPLDLLGRRLVSLSVAYNFLELARIISRKYCMSYRAERKYFLPCRFLTFFLFVLASLSHICFRSSIWFQYQAAINWINTTTKTKQKTALWRKNSFQTNFACI